ncbi:hypothetical protein BDW68DRAFT_192795 [Aspergillus falconensis]
MSSICSTPPPAPCRPATAASSTAALATSNTASNHATATAYLQTALEAITKTAAGQMDPGTCAAIVAPCLVGAETAAGSTSDTTDTDYIDGLECASDYSSAVDNDDVSVPDHTEFETESVLVGWTGLKAGQAWIWTSLDALAHAEANEAQNPISAVVRVCTEPPPSKTNPDLVTEEHPVAIPA